MTKKLATLFRWLCIAWLVFCAAVFGAYDAMADERCDMAQEGFAVITTSAGHERWQVWQQAMLVAQECNTPDKLATAIELIAIYDEKMGEQK